MAAHISSKQHPPRQLCGGEQQGDLPVFEHIDVSILTLIEHVFGCKEFELLAKMLRHADIKQYGLPGQGNSIAQITVANLASFAKHLGCGKDTLLRHLAIYRALGLLNQRRVSSQTLLSFPLRAYNVQPETTLPALDLLIHTGRPKLRQLAQSVKDRYQLSYTTGVGDRRTSSNSTVSELETLFLDIQLTLGAKRVTATRRQLLQNQIARVLVQLSATERSALDQRDQRNIPSRSWEVMRSQQGDQKIIVSGNQETTSKHRGDQVTTVSDEREDYKYQEGDLEASSPLRKEDLQLRQGDQDLISISGQGDFWPQEGDRAVQGDLQHKEGDCNVFSLSTQGELCAQEGDQATQFQAQQGNFSTQEGDFSAKVSPDVPFTYNVNYIILNITKKENNVIRRHIAQFFADTFQEKPIDNGFPSFAKYLRAFNIYEPKVIGRAFLVTLVLLHQKGWRVRRPGALFNKQCEILTGQKPLTHYTLDEVEEWLQTWGQVPYAELIEMLTQAPQIWQQREPSTLISSPFSSEEERCPARLSDSHSNQFDSEHAEAITAILEDEMRETVAGREPGQTEEQGQSFVLQGGMSPRSEEQRKERERYARKVRRQLVEAHVVVVQRDGTCGLEIDREHRCGCPLYRQNGLRHRCAHCIPDLSWSQEARDLIATILDV